jgi:exonuclease SbcC
MRIHNLSISNIASLRGDHFIDFDKVNESSNLFAITGKTGAGKSTILNCISLALYGDVYKKGSNSHDFVTLREAIGGIDLIFSINYKKYKASWRLRLRKKNGEELKKPQLTRLLFLLHTDGNEVAIDSTAEEICNLSFNQFCKTTILNQGEFSKFLTSNFTERKEILEKFYQGESLDSLNNYLKVKLKANLNKKEEKENFIKGITESFSDLNFTPKDIQCLKEDLQQNNKYLPLSNELLTHIKDALNLSETIKATQERNKLLVIKQAETQIRFNQFAQELDIINNQLGDQTSKLEKIKPILQEAIKKEVHGQGLTNQLNVLSNRLTTNKSNSVKTQIDSKEVNTKNSLLVEQLNNFEEQNIQFKEMNTNDFLLEFNQSSLTYNEFSILRDDINKGNHDLALKEEKLLGFKLVLKTLEQTLVETIPDILEEEIKQKNQQLEQISITLPTLKSYLEFEINFKKTNTHLNKTISDLKKETETIEKSLSMLAQEKKDIDKILKLYKLTESIHLCQKENIEKKQCVVCGNTDLTHSTNQLEINDSDFLECSNRLEQNQEHYSSYQEELNNIKIQLIGSEKEKIKLEQESKDKLDLTSIELAKVNEFTITEQINDKTLKELIEKRNSVKENIKLNSHKLQEFRLNQEKIYNQISTISSLNSDLNDLKEQLSIKINKHKDLGHLLLQVVRIYIPRTTNSDIDHQWAVLKIFEEKVQSYKKITQELKITTTKLQGLNQYLSKLEVEAKEIELEISTLTLDLKSIQEFISKNTENGRPAKELDTKEGLLSDTTNQYNKKSKELKLIEIQLAELRSKVDINKEQNKNSQILRSGIIQSIINVSREINGISEIKIDDFFLMVKITKNLSQLNEIEFSLSILYETLSQFTDLVKGLKDDTLAKEKKLSEFKALEKQRLDNQDKVKALNDELKKLQKKQYELDELNQLIGKDEFRNYVLAIIENLLLDQTNKELKILCQGRYGIIQTNKTNKMASEFKIVDFFMDGLERKISTLSGGETFLVSLAMAMALAELTRGSTQIDSLFIDEGFGTLDSDSINEVYDLLLEIQHSGKQIGVISHISDLTGRIPVNINLAKNQNGLSDINILLN